MAENRPEVLAPAGDFDSMRAAVAAGADAVYFGLDRFNARHRATNFEIERLPEIMRYLHRHRVKGYVAFNTLVFSDELPSAEACLEAIARAGVDAVIVQDIGNVRLCREVAPGLDIHASTQMTLTEGGGMHLATSLGISRIVAAREMSLADLRRIRTSCDIPLEVFIHGALCVAYSGQCLTSEALGGRSANRGQCAQACRQPYELWVDGQRRDTGDKSYHLSPQDLAAPEAVRELIELGVVSFKIEGRLKGPSYVTTAVTTYRKAIDAALNGTVHSPGAGEWRDLQQGFSRGFTPGFLRGIDHQKLVRGRSPRARGVRIGEVLRRDRNSVLVALDEPNTLLAEILKPGDGVVLDEARPEHDEAGGRVFSVRSGREKATVWVDIGPGDLPSDRGGAGAWLWKTDDPEFHARCKRQWTDPDLPGRHVLNFQLTGQPGSALKLTGTLENGATAVVLWDGPLVAARHEAPPGTLTKCLGRLGGTPFCLGTVECEMPEPVLLPASVLNTLRRDLVVALESALVPSAPATRPGALDRLRAARQTHTPADSQSPRLILLARTLEQIQAACTWQHESGLAPLAMVWVDVEDPRQWEEAIAICRGASIDVGLAPLRIVKPGEEGLITRAARLKPDAILVRNLATLELLRSSGIPLVGDYSLNVVNDLTAAWFFAQGLKRLTPGHDLNWQQLQAWLAHDHPDAIECIAHVAMPMFHTEHCVYAAHLSTGKDHTDCGRPCEQHRIRLVDPTGAHFPVMVDAGCRNTVFNAHVQSASEYIPRLIGMGVRNFRIELLGETPSEIHNLLTLYNRVLGGRDDGHGLWRSLRASSRVGLTRGTLNLA